jgi:hypothetical protein
MKTLFLLITMPLIFINFYGQNLNTNSQTMFVNEYYKHFDECRLPFSTQKVDMDYDSYNKLHNRIPKEVILKYIGNSKVDIGYDYFNTNPDTHEESSGFAEFYYYYLYRFKNSNNFFTLYIKLQGPDSTLIYIASYNQDGKNIDKLKLHGFINDTEFMKSVIISDFKIMVFKYEPIENFKKTKITVYNYEINNSGKFELINIESKEGKHHFTDYRDSYKNPDDDPINQY